MSFLSKAWSAVTGTIKAIISNPVTAIAAVALAIYAPQLGLRMLASMMVSSILTATTAKDNNPDNSTTSTAGNTQMLPAKTTNKIPAVYGKAFVSPILVDAKISSDNQTMWYVGALCEAPTTGTATVSFGKVLWDGQVATFGSNGRVTKLTNAAGQEDTKIDGNLWVYFFNGSDTQIGGSGQTAYQILQDTAIPAAARWTGTEKMNHTIFVIIKLVYSTDDNVTGLPGNLQFETNIYQNGISDGYRPGAAMLDYLTNARFGAGLDSTDVNTQSFLDLDTYADQVITYTPVGGGSTTQPRYRFNGMIDPTQSIMANWQQMAQCSDSFIQYNEALGKWSVITNKAYDQGPNSKTINDLFRLDPNNIIGGINITPLDLNSTPNSVESVFFNYKSNGQSDSVYAETPQALQNMFEPPQRLTMNYAFVNDYVRAQYLSNRKLEQCRADYIVDLTADYSAITVDAGDVVVLTYEPHGGSGLSWINKPFRVTQIQESRTEDGSLLCKLQLSEYSSDVYDNKTIQDYTPPLSNYVVDPGLLSKPDTPTITDILPAADVPSFTVTGKVPDNGITVAIEFWYGPTEAITDNNYKLYDRQYNSSGSQYAQSTPGNPIYETITVNGMPAGTIYWRIRVVGLVRKSEFSDAVEIQWAPAAPRAVGDVDANGLDSSMVYVPYVNGTTNWPDNTRGIMPRVNLITKDNPGAIHIYFSASVWSSYASPNFYADYNCLEVWKSVASDVFTHKTYSIRHSYDFTNDVGGVHTPATQRIQTVGLDMDYYSDDGGDTWSPYDAASTLKSVSAAVSYWSGNGSTPSYGTVGVGSWQVKDVNTTSFANAAKREAQGLDTDGIYPLKFNYQLGWISGTVPDSTSMNDVAVVCHTGGNGLSATPTTSNRHRTLAVGDNGTIYRYTNNDSLPIDVSNSSGQSFWFTKETSGTLQNLYSVYANDKDGSGQYVAIIVGDFGTILKSIRTNGSNLAETWDSKVAHNIDGTEFVKTLFAVAGDDTPLSTGVGTWVAVGQNGGIVVSTDGGETWDQRIVTLDDGTLVVDTLRAVRYGAGNWLVCGDNGLVFTSTDTITWYRVTVPSGYEKRNLYSIDYSSVWDKFNIGGEGLILTSPGPTIGLSLSNVHMSPDETYTLKRLWYRGSWANAKTIGTPVDPHNRLVNGQTISSTIIDTDYKQGDELGYYLVVGNIKGVALAPADALRCGGAVITATEYKK